MTTLKVTYAVYGALPNGSATNAEAFNVAGKLQTLFQQSGTVACNNTNFGDPSPGNQKHFGALVMRDGKPYYFACEENQTINFDSGGSPPNVSPYTVKTAVYGALTGGNSNTAVAFDVTAEVQGALTNGSVVNCNNTVFGDPSYGNTKHFAAVVTRNGKDHYFACQENQTIDFAQGGGAG